MLRYFDDPDASWLIFKTGPSELGVHPTSGGEEGQGWSTPQRHEVTLMCDDIEATVAELSAKGATFEGGVRDQGFGLGTTLVIPGAGTMLLYQPKHPPAYAL